MSQLIVQQLARDFGGLRALYNVDMSIKEGELVGVVGPNGAGKTTLFNVICGKLKPTSGKVYFHGDDITGLQSHQIARKGIARTFQLTNLFPNVTVMDNVLIGLHRLVESPLWLGFTEAILGLGSFKRKEKQAKEKALEILEFLDLSGSRSLLAGSLPHVDQRKLEIAIALASNPKLLFLDEPAAGMQHGAADELSSTVKILRDRGITIVLVDHNMKFVMGVCEHIIVLHHGSKIAEGTPQEISTNKDVKAVYLG